MEDIYDQKMKEKADPKAVSATMKKEVFNVEKDLSLDLSLIEVKEGGSYFHEVLMEYELVHSFEVYCTYIQYMDMKTRYKTDPSVESFELLKHIAYDEGEFAFFRGTSKKMFKIINGKECLFCKGYRKLGPGRYIEVAKSFTHEDFPPDPEKNIVEIVQSVFISEEFEQPDGSFRLKTKCFVKFDPKLGVSLRIIKGIIARLYKGANKIILAEIDEWVEKKYTPELRNIQRE